MSRKLGGSVPFWEGEHGPHLKTVAWGEAYLDTKWHLNPSSHLTTTDGPKIGAVPFGEGELGPLLGLPACQVSS